MFCIIPVFDTSVILSSPICAIWTLSSIPFLFLKLALQSSKSNVQMKISKPSIGFVVDVVSRFNVDCSDVASGKTEEMAVESNEFVANVCV